MPQCIGLTYPSEFVGKSLEILDRWEIFSGFRDPKNHLCPIREDIMWRMGRAERESEIFFSIALVSGFTLRSCLGSRCGAARESPHRPRSV